MKYNLVGIDGNAFSIMGYVKSAMREQGFTKDEIDCYLKNAKSSDYNNLLNVSVYYIDMCNSRVANQGIGQVFSAED